MRLTPCRRFDAIRALGAFHRPVVYREGHRIALPQRHHLGAALHAWTLFREDKLSAGEIAPGLGEQDCDLEREREIAVEVLVQAIEVARNILQ